MFIGHVEDQDEKIDWYSSSSWFLGQSYRDILKILDLFNNAMQQRKKGLMDGLFSNKTTSKLELTEQDLQGLFDSF